MSAWQRRDMTQLLIFECLINEHVTVYCSHCNLRLTRMPADRVNNFLLQLCLNRVEVGVIHGHKLHVI